MGHSPTGALVMAFAPEQTARIVNPPTMGSGGFMSNRGWHAVTRGYVMTAAAAALAGFGIGCASFRLPAWACGPFRADKAAEWSGVLVAAIAAAVTLVAVIVALRTAKDARETALQLQQNEYDRQRAKDDAMRARLAVVFTRELYMLYGELQEYKTQLLIVAMPDTWGDIYSCLTELLPGEHLSLLERFAPDLHVFSIEDSTALLNVLSSWITYRQAPGPPEFAEQNYALQGAEVTIKTTQNLMDDVYLAHEAMRARVPQGIEVTPLSEVA